MRTPLYKTKISVVNLKEKSKKLDNQNKFYRGSYRTIMPSKQRVFINIDLRVYTMSNYEQRDLF